MLPDSRRNLEFSGDCPYMPRITTACSCIASEYSVMRWCECSFPVYATSKHGPETPFLTTKLQNVEIFATGRDRTELLDFDAVIDAFAAGHKTDVVIVFRSFCRT